MIARYTIAVRIAISQSGVPRWNSTSGLRFQFELRELLERLPERVVATVPQLAPGPLLDRLHRAAALRGRPAAARRQPHQLRAGIVRVGDAADVASRLE